MPPKSAKNRHGGVGGGKLGEWLWVLEGKTEHKAQRVILPAAEPPLPPVDMVLPPPPQPLQLEEDATGVSAAAATATTTTTPYVLVQWESRRREYVPAENCRPMFVLSNDGTQQRPSRTKAKPKIEEEKQVVVGKAAASVKKGLKKKQNVEPERKINAKAVAAPATTPLLRQTIVKLKSAESSGKHGSGSVKMSIGDDSLSQKRALLQKSMKTTASSGGPVYRSGVGTAATAVHDDQKRSTMQAASANSVRGSTNGIAGAAAADAAAAAHEHESQHKTMDPLQPLPTLLASEAHVNSRAATAAASAHVQRPTYDTLNNNSSSTLQTAPLMSAGGTVGSSRAAVVVAAAVAPAAAMVSGSAAASAPMQIMISRSGSRFKRRTARKSIVAAATAAAAEITAPQQRIVAVLTGTNNNASSAAAAHIQTSGDGIFCKRRRSEYDGSLLQDASPNQQARRRTSDDFSSVRTRRMQTAAKAPRSTKRAAASKDDSSDDDRKPASRTETRQYSEWSSSDESGPTSDNNDRMLKVKKQRQEQPPPVEDDNDVICLLDSSDDEDHAAGPPVEAASNDNCNNDDDDDQSDMSDRKPKARDIIDLVETSSDDDDDEAISETAVRPISALAPPVAAAVRAPSRGRNETNVGPQTRGRNEIVPVALTKPKRRYKLIRDDNGTPKKKTTTVVPESIDLDNSAVNDIVRQMHETDLYLQQVQRGMDGRFKVVAESSASSSYQCGGQSLFFAKRYEDKYKKLVQIIMVDADNNYSSVYKTDEQIHPLPNLYLPRMDKLYKSSSEDDDEGESDGDVQGGDDYYYSGE